MKSSAAALAPLDDAEELQPLILDEGVHLEGRLVGEARIEARRHVVRLRIVGRVEDLVEARSRTVTTVEVVARAIRRAVVDGPREAGAEVLAGGGLRTGQAIGTTNELGMEIVDRPVSVPDLFATIFLGISFLSGQLGLVPDPSEETTIISQLASTVLGDGSPAHAPDDT